MLTRKRPGDPRRALFTKDMSAELFADFEAAAMDYINGDDA